MTAAPLIAKRYLLASRGSLFLRWMTGLAIAGITIGIAVMIVVLSVINGFQTQLRELFLAANAHVMAFQYPSGLDDAEAWTKLIEKDFGSQIKGISPFVQAETLATKDGLMQNILIRGIDPMKRKAAQDMSPMIRPKTAIDELQKSFESNDQKEKPRPIIIGSGLLSILQAEVGGTIRLLAPDSSSVGDMREFRVVGVYDSGLKHYDNRIGILAINDSQEFFQLEKRVHGLEIGLNDPKESEAIADKMREKYSLTIKEWLSFNKSMFDMLQKERAVIALIVALVAFVASFNILTTLLISVTQKQRSISVLKALGASNWQIQKIFLLKGLFIGFIGSILGMILALGISKVLQTFKIVELPDLYMLAQLPVNYDWTVYAGIAVAGCLICVLAGAYPAWAASRVNIVEGFRGR
jgi:lipoprotein-releasing system permease protein